jgi:hypothetical protein
MSIEAMKQALEALEDADQILADEGYGHALQNEAITALRTAIEQAEQSKEQMMPITDDNGQATSPQYRVIERRGNWLLLFDIHVVGNLARHEFRIQKLRHDIALYPEITLEEAKKRFTEKVEADNE